MKRKALIVWGGWDGHEPNLVAGRFQRILEEEDFEVIISDSLDAYADAGSLKQYHLIVPVWTGGILSYEWCTNIQNAIAEGTGMAGCHGGMCDSFRENTEWQFLTGGQWVSHPGGGEINYRVNVRNVTNHPIIEDIHDFNVCSEQYYLHVDPAVHILATTRFPVATGEYEANGTMDMPVMWTKMWGKGRLFYSSLGHHEDIFNIPEAELTMRRGMLWAAEGKDMAMKKK